MEILNHLSKVNSDTMRGISKELDLLYQTCTDKVGVLRRRGWVTIQKKVEVGPFGAAIKVTRVTITRDGRRVAQLEGQ